MSCISRSQCTATGMASTRSGKNMKTLAERWNGTTWAVQSTPTPTSRTLRGGTLSGGVSCTSSTACVADGFSYSKNSMRLLGEGWNGHAWTAQPDATPVVAAEPGTWTVLTTPSPATLSALVPVSCSSPVHCVAVGASSATAAGAISPLTEVWNGTTWTAVTAPR